MGNKDTSVQEEYMLSRSYRASARLHLQHWLWKYTLGYNLHPSIPTSCPNLQIVDIGTGNGCWLLEVAKEIPQTCQLDGFDISASQFPHPNFLPSNITLKTLDVFGDIPDGLVGKYDIVHIRAFAIVVKNGDPGPLLENLVKMLNPRGYLQWDDKDMATWRAEAPSPEILHPALDELLRRWHAQCAVGGIDLRWLSHLPTHLTAHNLTLLHAFHTAIPTELLKATTDNFLTALEDMALNVIARDRGTGVMGSKADFEELWGRVVGEYEKGVALRADVVGVVGRKGE